MLASRYVNARPPSAHSEQQRGGITKVLRGSWRGISTSEIHMEADTAVRKCAFSPWISKGPEPFTPSRQASGSYSFPPQPSSATSLLPSWMKHWHCPSPSLVSSLLSIIVIINVTVPFPDEGSYLVKRDLGASH